MSALFVERLLATGAALFVLGLLVLVMFSLFGRRKEAPPREFTPNFKIPLPIPHFDEDVWGGLVNDAVRRLDHETAETQRRVAALEARLRIRGWS